MGNFRLPHLTCTHVYNYCASFLEGSIIYERYMVVANSNNCSNCSTATVTTIVTI